MDTILFPQPNGENLLKAVKLYLETDDFEHISICTDIGDDPAVLSKITKNIKEKRFFGSETVDNIPMHKTNEEIFTSKTLVFRTFEFGDEKIVQANYRYPQDVAFDLFFVKRGKSKIIEQLILKYKESKKKAKQLYVWDRKWIDVNRLDTKNFIMPSKVESIVEKDIWPQLETKTIYNHALFYSPPGFGKTALGRYLAKKYIDWTFISVNPATLEKPFHVFNTFEYAASYKPAIVFFEDIDTLGQNRGESSEYNPFLGALLNSIDGLETHTDIYVIATTNNPTAIDIALRRAGRLGIHVPFRYTRDELIKIFNTYAGTKYTYEEIPFISKLNPAQIRSIAKSVLGKTKLEKIPLTIDLITSTTKEISEEEIIVTDFTAMQSTSPDQACKEAEAKRAEMRKCGPNVN